MDVFEIKRKAFHLLILLVIVGYVIIEKNYNKAAIGNSFIESSPGVMWITLSQGGLVRFIEQKNHKEYNIN